MLVYFVFQDIQRSVKTVSTAVNAVPVKIARNVDVVFDGISKVFTQKDINDENVTNSKVYSPLNGQYSIYSSLIGQ